MLSIIVARAENGVIGRENKLPWRLSNDLRFFKKVTLGKPVIMGRKTFESIGRPLPGRTNIVVTRNRDWSAEGVKVTHSLEEAVAIAHEDKTEIMVIGGEELYKRALGMADKIYLTLVKANVEGDASFPVLLANWEEIERVSHPADEKNDFAHDFLIYQRES